MQKIISLISIIVFVLVTGCRGTGYGTVGAGYGRMAPPAYGPVTPINGGAMPYGSPPLMYGMPTMATGGPMNGCSFPPSQTFTLYNETTAGERISVGLLDSDIFQFVPCDGRVAVPGAGMPMIGSGFAGHYVTNASGKFAVTVGVFRTLPGAPPQLIGTRQLTVEVPYFTNELAYHVFDGNYRLVSK